MYYSNLQVNYMVTVSIRYLLLFSLYVCFHVLNAWVVGVASGVCVLSSESHPRATLGTRRIRKRYQYGTINICKSRLEVHLANTFLNTSVVLVLFGYSKGAQKVSGKCIKGTPGVSEGVFKVPGCQSLA